ncbi:TPA: hypothetical protein RQN23_003860 [Aeromonas veronii]|nr:hypothetical protein [Aeromonas veronii]
MKGESERAIANILDDVSRAFGFDRFLNICRPLDTAAAFMKALHQTDGIAHSRAHSKPAETLIMELFSSHEDFTGLVRALPFKDFITHDLLSHIQLDTSWIARDNISLSNQEFGDALLALSRKGALSEQHQKNFISILSKLKVSSDQAAYLYNAELNFIRPEFKKINLSNISDCGFQYFFHMQLTQGLAKNGIHVSTLNSNISSFTLCDVCSTTLPNEHASMEALAITRQIQADAKQWGRHRHQCTQSDTETPHQRIDAMTAMLFAATAKGFTAMKEGRDIPNDVTRTVKELCASIPPGIEDGSAISTFATRKLIKEFAPLAAGQQAQVQHHHPSRHH